MNDEAHWTCPKWVRIVGDDVHLHYFTEKEKYNVILPISRKKERLEMWFQSNRVMKKTHLRNRIWESSSDKILSTSTSFSNSSSVSQWIENWVVWYGKHGNKRVGMRRDPAVLVGLRIQPQYLEVEPKFLTKNTRFLFPTHHQPQTKRESRA